MQRVSTLKDHQKAQKVKRKAAKEFEYFINAFILLRPFRKIAKSYYKRRFVCLSVRPSTWNNFAPTATEWIFVKFDI